MPADRIQLQSSRSIAGLSITLDSTRGEASPSGSKNPFWNRTSFDGWSGAKAAIWQHCDRKGKPHPRDESLRHIRKRWKRNAGYHRRSIAETTIFGF